MLSIPLIYFNSFIFIDLLFSAGVGRTGVFIALTNLIERVKTEGVVDVYQTVKKMRQQRTAMVQTRVSFIIGMAVLFVWLIKAIIFPATIIKVRVEINVKSAWLIITLILSGFIENLLENQKYIFFSFDVFFRTNTNSVTEHFKNILNRLTCMPTSTDWLRVDNTQF